jgi:AraC family transcriptional regulator, regulatory protein of adaptative response / methylated-DNA-[protein]-cysteine methyltransferase
MKTSLFLKTIDSPVWPLTLWIVQDTLCLLEFWDTQRRNREITEILKHFDAEISQNTHPLFEKVEQELQEYFSGRRKHFDIPLTPFGTDLQKKTWEVLQTIPYGETRSYKKQAEILWNPKAVRAVANANGKNRIGIIIPCHRVIGSNGSLTGFGGGIENKKYLLELEACNK